MSFVRGYSEREHKAERLFTHSKCETACVLGENPIQTKEKELKIRVEPCGN